MLSGPTAPIGPLRGAVGPAKAGLEVRPADRTQINLPLPSSYLLRERYLLDRRTFVSLERLQRVETFGIQCVGIGEQLSIKT